MEQVIKSRSVIAHENHMRRHALLAVSPVPEWLLRNLDGLMAAWRLISRYSRIASIYLLMLMLAPFLAVIVEPITGYAFFDSSRHAMEIYLGYLRSGVFLSTWVLLVVTTACARFVLQDQLALTTFKADWRRTLRGRGVYPLPTNGASVNSANQKSHF
jgi:hypothetical protein